MFDFHRRDPRKTVSAALQTADRMSQHGCGRDPTNSDAIDRAGRLYDLTHAIHELHENLALPGINLDELDHARQIVRCIEEELFCRRPELGPRGLVARATWDLNALLERAAGREGELIGSERDAHAAVRWLQNEMHNVYLRWLLTERRTGRRR